MSRTKFSRVLNHRFPNDVCGVVHERSARGVPQYSWVSKHSSNKIFETKSGAYKFPVDVILGPDSPDLTSIHQKSYRGCVQAAKESRHYRNKYFSSYYWTKSLEGKKEWMRTCDANTASVPGNIIKGLGGVDFAHNFRRICEKDELYLLNIDQSPQAPYRSPRPKSRGVN